MHVFFFNLQNVSFLCNCRGLAIIVTKNSIAASIWSENLQYGLTYTMQIWSHIYDAIRCEPSDVSGYLIRTSGCLIWHDLTTLPKKYSECQSMISGPSWNFKIGLRMSKFDIRSQFECQHKISNVKISHSARVRMSKPQKV